MNDVYDWDSDYPKVSYAKDSVGGNPYQCCAYCGRSTSDINGNLMNHTDWCRYRVARQNDQTNVST